MQNARVGAAVGVSATPSLPHLSASTETVNPQLLLLFALPALLLPERGAGSASQVDSGLNYIPASVDFSNLLQEWDGFGFNYVETAQTRDYDARPQDYGGFSLLPPESRREILELVFGDDGLQVEIVKMFLDPWHQVEPGGPFDHQKTTRYMLEFAESGAEIAKAAGRELTVITTLYGPPPWATQQGFIGARDLDEERLPELADYMIDWARFLRERGINIRFLSVHNEGEDFYRWNYEDATQRFHHFDYNAYWSPEAVNRFVVLLSKRLAEQGLTDIGVTTGSHRTGLVFATGATQPPWRGIPNSSITWTCSRPTALLEETIQSSVMELPTE